MILSSSPLPQIVLKLYDLLMPSAYPHSGWNGNWGCGPLHIGVTYVRNPDSCTTSNHLRVSFWDPPPERPQVMTVVSSALLEKSLETHWRRTQTGLHFCSRMPALVVSLLFAIRQGQAGILSEAICWRKEGNGGKICF